jgi:hypothetical protein
MLHVNNLTPPGSECSPTRARSHSFCVSGEKYASSISAQKSATRGLNRVHIYSLDLRGLIEVNDVVASAVVRDKAAGVEDLLCEWTIGSKG